MTSDHRTLFTVQSDACIMERFFGVSQLEREISDTSFKDTPEVSWNQGSSNG